MPSLQISAELRKKLDSRFERALNYLSIYAFVLVVYGGAIITEYILLGLLWYVLLNGNEAYTDLKKLIDFVKVGTAMLAAIAASFHAVLSTISQILLDLEIFQEGSK